MNLNFVSFILGFIGGCVRNSPRISDSFRCETSVYGFETISLPPPTMERFVFLWPNIWSNSMQLHSRAAWPRPNWRHRLADGHDRPLKSHPICSTEPRSTPSIRSIRNWHDNSQLDLCWIWSISFPGARSPALANHLSGILCSARQLCLNRSRTSME